MKHCQLDDPAAPAGAARRLNPGSWREKQGLNAEKNSALTPGWRCFLLTFLFIGPSIPITVKLGSPEWFVWKMRKTVEPEKTF